MTNNVDDEIVEEIRRRREAPAESLGFDLRRITEDLQPCEQEAGVPVVHRPSRRPVSRSKRSSA